jgi:cobaltochelatase CobS
VRKHPSFVCIAGANTIGQGATSEYNGRYKPDAAFVDRFCMIRWDVDETLERTLALGRIEDKELGNRWVDLVQRVRSKIASEGSVKHVVSPRASIGGCALLHAGLTWDEAIESRLRKGLDQAVWDRVSK